MESTRLTTSLLEVTAGKLSTQAAQIDTINMHLGKHSSQLERLETLLFSVPDLRELDAAIQNLVRVQTSIQGKRLYCEVQTTGGESASSEIAIAPAAVAVTDGRAIDDNICHSTTVCGERTTPGKMVGTQCPEEPCHIIFHEVYHKEAEYTLLVNQAVANDEWEPLQSGSAFLAGSVIRVRDRFSSMEDDQLPIRLPTNIAGYVGRVEAEDGSGDAHVWFPSLAVHTYGWRFIAAKHACCVEVCSSGE